MHWDGFLTHLKSWLERRELLRTEMRWVVGVSGGRDSTVLAHGMVALRAREQLAWEIQLAHLHHGLRGQEADADAEFVQQLAGELDVNCHLHHEDIARRVAEEGGSTEEVARRYRYEFLERVALRTGSDWVAVAHHADDDAETVLHRICRGTGLRGLAGMHEVRALQPGSRIKLVRPLLQIRRQAIDALHYERGLTSRLDESNLTDEYTRGRIRNSVMPVLRAQLNPNVSEALLRLAEQSRWLGTYLEDAAGRTFESLVVESSPGKIVLSTPRLLSKNKIIQAEIVRRTVQLLTEGGQEVGFANVESVLNLAASGGTGKELHLPGPIAVRKSYEQIEFRPLIAEEDTPELAPTGVNCPGNTLLPVLGTELRAELCDVTPQMLEDVKERGEPREEYIDFDTLNLPLVVRGRRPGDRFWPLGAPGTKTLSDFFIDEKIDAETRGRTGILCDQTGPIWVMQLRIDERVKLRPTSRRALHLRVAGGNGG